LIRDGTIEPAIGPKIMKHFMPSFKKAFAEHVKEIATVKVNFLSIVFFLISSNQVSSLSRLENYILLN
jgi:hypothetical protein